MAGTNLKDDTLTPSAHVMLWTAPRCMSSVFERSIRELKSVKVFYEPHQQAYYCGPERVNSECLDYLEFNPTASYQDVDEMLLQSYDGYKAIFAKNMAFFIEEQYQRYTNGRFTMFKHTFLIRHPHKSIPSLFRAPKRCSLSLPPNENGFEQLHDLLKTVQQFTDPNPVVIDADDLLMNPRSILEHYCSAVGLPFEESMLTWTPGVVKDWTFDFPHYQAWHETAMMSSGFMKPKEAQPEDNLPKEVEDAIKKALPFYDYMHAYRIKL